MSLLLKNCLIYDQNSKYHFKKKNLFISNGIIESIGSNSKASKEVDLRGAILCPGWMDLNANFCDPGFEHKEDLQTGSAAACFGGVTDVVILPNTNPVLDTKGDIEYVKFKSGNPVNLLPVGALSEGVKGENLSEILDLHTAGAVAFSDGQNPIWNSELLLKALQYIQKIDGVIISRPSDRNLSKNTHMHEGKNSTLLGLKGEPAISEKVQISNQLEVLRYAGGRIHFSMISTSEGLRLIKKAKNDGLKVTCDVGVNHLKFTDNSLTSFDSNYKVQPPFRTEKDRRALIRGVNEGTIDAIVSGHQPQDSESKLLEFDLASPGMTSIQTMFSVLVSLREELNLDNAIDKLTHGPRRILGHELVEIKEGSQARLSFFDPTEEWILNKNTNKSKSMNSPFWENPLKGKAIGIVVGDRLVMNS